jgi:4-amino-4-deoxy-L-arabinose transferase-like glycosyltransferase
MMTYNSQTANKEITRSDKLVAAALAALTILLLLLSAPGIGVVWDEPTYFVAAETYPGWVSKLLTQPVQALSAEGVAAYWTYNNEHPPFSKVWSGFIWLGARHLFSDLVAHRLGNILLSGVLVSLLYLFLAREYGRTAGLAGAAALLTMPRFFFHMHLASLDVPVTLMIFAAAYVFWRGRNRSGWRWTLLLGLVWGMGLITKINALFIPPIVFGVWILVFRRELYLFGRLALMGVIGVCFFFASWPWLYHDTINRLVSYLGFLTIDRGEIEQYYFGHLHTAPYAPLPWHFPFVMTSLVVPFMLILLAAAGAFYMMKKRSERSLGGLFLLGAFVSLLVLATGQGQVYDNERLAMPVFPFLAGLAGVGFAQLIPLAKQGLAKKELVVGRGRLALVLAAVAFGPQIVIAADIYPHLLAYYSEAIGGAYGAKFLQLETTYWCESYGETLPYLNAHAEPEAAVWGECHDVLLYYQLQGRLRPDLEIMQRPSAKVAFPEVSLLSGGHEEADYVVIQYRQSGHYRAMREWMYPREPVHEVMYRRLRLAEVYEQDRFR